jgi:hypothetical protein
MIADYEVMPWPDRIYEGLYRTSANSDKKAQIPRFYSTQMQVMINTLNDMPLSENKVSGSQGIGILMANSLMFQRFPTHSGYEDPQLSNFYGQALPLLKRGVPVKTVHIENLSFEQTLKEIKILIMSYSNMKPMDKKAHDHLVQWVKNGGILVYCGRDDDAFQSVQEWWNTNGYKFKAPSEHLFRTLGLNEPFNAGEYNVGRGKVSIIRMDPKEFVLEKEKDNELVAMISKLYNVKGSSLEFKNHFKLTRGPYEIVSVVDENNDQSPYIMKGKFIDLFDPEIPVLNEKQVKPGEQAFLYNVNSVKDKKTPQVLATAARVYDEKRTKKEYSFVAKSPLNTTNVMRLLLPSKATKVEISDASGKTLPFDTSWDEPSKTCYLKFENNPEGVYVKMTW